MTGRPARISGEVIVRNIPAAPDRVMARCRGEAMNPPMLGRTVHGIRRFAAGRALSDRRGSALEVDEADGALGRGVGRIALGLFDGLGLADFAVRLFLALGHRLFLNGRGARPALTPVRAP